MTEGQNFLVTDGFQTWSSNILLDLNDDLFMLKWYIISGKSRVVTDYTLLLLTYIDCDNFIKQHQYIQ